MRRKKLLLIIFLAAMMLLPMPEVPMIPQITENNIQPQEQYSLSTDYNVVLAADSDDDWWQTDTGPTHYTEASTVYCRWAGGVSYFGQMRFQLNIPKDATISSATVSMYDEFDGGPATAKAWRIDLANCPDLEATEPMPSADDSESADLGFDGATGWDTYTVTNLVQSQVNLGDWESGFYIGFQCNFTTEATANDMGWYDYSDANDYHPYMNVTYSENGEEPPETEEYSAEIAQDIDDTYWWWDSGWAPQNDDIRHYYVNTTNPYLGWPVFRWPLPIPRDSTIVSANVTVYLNVTGQDAWGEIWLIDEANPGPMEYDVVKPTVDTTTNATMQIQNLGPYWQEADITDLVQNHVDRLDFVEGNYIGLMYQMNSTDASAAFNEIEDYQCPTTENNAYINVTYIPSEGGAEWLSGWSRRRWHTIEQEAGAGTDYEVSIYVYYSYGETENDSLYANTNCNFSFVDIRFTTSDGTTLLDYNLNGTFEGTEVEYFTDEARYGITGAAHSGNYPATYYYNGRTYVSWHGDNDAGDTYPNFDAGDPYIRFYDHSTGIWSDDVKIADNPLVDDFHGAPALWVDNDGYIHVLYGAHSSNLLQHAISNGAETITAGFTVLDEIGTDVTYPKISYDTVSDVVHLIYRWVDQAGDDDYFYRYMNSTDNGETWSDEYTWLSIDDGGGYGDGAYPYILGASGLLDPYSKDRIHLAFAIYNETEGGSGNENMYYCYLNLTDYHVYDVEGVDYGTIDSEAELNDNFMIFDTNDYFTDVSSVKVDSSHIPYILFASEYNDNNGHNFFTYWNGTGWNPLDEICDVDRYSAGGDMIVYASDNITAFLTDVEDMTRWYWDGNSWSKEETIRTATGGRDLANALVTAPYGLEPEEELVMVYGEFYDSYDCKGYAWNWDGNVNITGSDYAKFWVTITGDLSASAQLIYVYYDNPGAASASQDLDYTTGNDPDHGGWGDEELSYYHYVDNNDSDWDSSADKGTHSNFANQQDGPDLLNDTLTEVDVSTPAEDAENDIDNNSTDVDSFPDIGVEINWNYCQGTSIDSNVMTITEENVGGGSGEDFKILRGTTTINSGQTTKTINEGVDYTLESGQDATTCFIRITNTRITGMGRTSGGGSQYESDFTVRIDNPENIETYVTFTRLGTTNDCRFTWEILQYIGASGGNNELIIRQVADVTCGGTLQTVDGATITTIIDIDKVAVFITGQGVLDPNRADWWNVLFTAEMVADGADWVARLTRGKAGGGQTGHISYAVVEFTGSNWRDVQRLEMTTEATAWTTSTDNYNDVNIVDEGGINLLNASRAFLHLQYRTDNDNCGLDDAGDTVEILSTTQLRIRNRATAGTRWKVVWIVENTGSGSGAMSVEHVHFYDSTTSGSEERSWTQSIAEISSMDKASIFGCASVDGSGTAYPRGAIDYRLTSTTQVTFTESDAGQERMISFDVIQWPAELTTNYVLNFEYQWTTADYDETNEQVCIYVTSVASSGENLTVSYWTGSEWTFLYNITNTGWSNFTATALTSATYTIRLSGGLNVSDGIEDEWQIDLITLHIWTSSTPDYQLDLEVQWTSVNYGEDNEYLCIYTGSVASENLTVDYWNGTGWENIITKLNATSWNNVSIHDYLTASTFTIRYRDTNRTGDSSSQDSWEIDAAIIWTYPTTNDPPLNVGSPTLTNPDDTDNMYAVIREYHITANATDENGALDIAYIDVTCTSDDRQTEYWVIRFNMTLYSFSEESDSSDYIALNTTSSEYEQTSGGFNLVFHLSVNWNHPDVSDVDTKQLVRDDADYTDVDWSEANWDIETQLDLSVGPTMDDGSGTANRGDLDGAVSGTGTLVYYGGTSHPPDDEIDVWVSASEYGTEVGPWEATDYEASGGTFTASCYADNAVGQDTFTFKTVVEDDGSGGADLMHTTHQTTYIADRVEWYLSGVDDGRININTNGLTYWKARYEHDSSDITSGLTAELNGSKSLSHNGTHWVYQESKSSVQLVGYGIDLCEESTHGLDGWQQSAENRSIIWDRVQVQSYTVSDNHDNINDDVTIDVLLWYDYDDTLVTDGTVTINGISAAYQGSGIWRITENKATVQQITYDTVAASGNTHGITVMDQNGQSDSVIWDQIVVQTTVSDDTRDNINDNVEIRVTLWLDFADEYLGTGDSVTLDGVAMTWDSGNSWFDLSRTKASVGIWKYYVNSSSEATYGITALDLNSQEQDVIWDRLVIDIQADDETPENEQTVTFTLTVIFDYDDSTCTIYLLVIDRNLTWWYSFNNANKTSFQDTNSNKTYNFTTRHITSESTYGITVFTTNLETVVWYTAANNVPADDGPVGGLPGSDDPTLFDFLLIVIVPVIVIIIGGGFLILRAPGPLKFVIVIIIILVILFLLFPHILGVLGL